MTDFCPKLYMPPYFLFFIYPYSCVLQGYATRLLVNNHLDVVLLFISNLYFCAKNFLTHIFPIRRCGVFVLLFSFCSIPELKTPCQMSCTGVGHVHSSNNLQTVARSSNKKCTEILTQKDMLIGWFLLQTNQFAFIWTLKDTLQRAQTFARHFGGVKQDIRLEVLLLCEIKWYMDHNNTCENIFRNSFVVVNRQMGMMGMMAFRHSLLFQFRYTRIMHVDVTCQYVPKNMSCTSISENLCLDILTCQCCH